MQVLCCYYSVLLLTQFVCISHSHGKNANVATCFVLALKEIIMLIPHETVRILKTSFFPNLPVGITVTNLPVTMGNGCNQLPAIAPQEAALCAEGGFR